MWLESLRLFPKVTVMGPSRFSGNRGHASFEFNNSYPLIDELISQISDIICNFCATPDFSPF